MSGWFIGEKTEFYEIPRPSWDYLDRIVAPDYLEYLNPRIVERQKIYLFQAESEYEFAGYSLFTPKIGSSDTCNMIHMLTVLEDRLEGIGTRLFKYAEKLLRQEGINRIESFSLEGDSGETDSFLKSLGMEQFNERKLMTYTVDQLLSAPIRRVDDSKLTSIKRLADLDENKISGLFGGKGRCLLGIDPELSAILVQEGRYCGLTAIRAGEAGVRLESLQVAGGKNIKESYLKLWAYTVSRLIEAAEKNNLDRVTLTVDSQAGAIEKVIGIPTDVVSVPMYAKCIR